MPNGRGVTMNGENTELFEGFFKDGEKHGPFRSIEMSKNSSLVTVTEGIYDKGELMNFGQTLVQVVFGSEKFAPPKQFTS